MRSLILQLITVCAIMCAASLASAAYTVDFDIDTTSLVQSGQLLGSLEFQLTGGRATISNLSGVTFRDATGGTAPIPASFDLAYNSDIALYDFYQKVNFGNEIRFRLNLDSAPNNPFGMYLFNADETATLLAKDWEGYIVRIASNENGFDISKSDPVHVTPTPIPAAAYLLGTGLIGLIGLRRKVVGTDEK